MMAQNEVQQLLDLPIVTLAALSAGYISYRVAYTGKDAKHGSVDVVLMTFVFGFITKTIAALGEFEGAPSWLPSATIILGMATSFASACIWRKWGEEWVFDRLRKLGVSSSDRCTTAWETMLQRGRSPQRLFVRKINGDALLTDSLWDFNNAPLGPCVFGQDGSIGMYVTDFRGKDEEDWTAREVYDPDTPDWGHTMTFIPASEIAEVRINLLTAETIKNLKSVRKSTVSTS